MNILILNDATTSARGHLLARQLLIDLTNLGFNAVNSGTTNKDHPHDFAVVRLVDHLPPNQSGCVAIEGSETLLERVLRVLPLDFNRLPLFVTGESKVVKLWTARTVVMRFKPTVYSFTTNRYGVVTGTDELRTKFTAAVFREMSRNRFCEPAPRNAFLAEIQSTHGPLIVEKLVTECNLETRVKRYHIGSPVHRYRYTEKISPANGTQPVSRWTRFDSPVVCFDWRHPLTTQAGERLADEPLSDDYAALWMRNVSYAKEMARHTFLWLENLFLEAGLRLIDMCLFIDRDGRTIYGEISPDCMRVRLDLGDPRDAEAADKDLWRDGRAPHELRERYEELYQRLFSQKETKQGV